MVCNGRRMLRMLLSTTNLAGYHSIPYEKTPSHSCRTYNMNDFPCSITHGIYTQLLRPFSTSAEPPSRFSLHCTCPMHKAWIFFRHFHRFRNISSFSWSRLSSMHLMSRLLIPNLSLLLTILCPGSFSALALSLPLPFFYPYSSFLRISLSRAR